MLLADLRDQLDLHGISQAQQYLQEKLSGNGSAPVKRLISTDPSFKEASHTFLLIVQHMHVRHAGADVISPRILAGPLICRCPMTQICGIFLSDFSRRETQHQRVTLLLHRQFYTRLEFLNWSWGAQTVAD